MKKLVQLGFVCFMMEELKSLTPQRNNVLKRAGADWQAET